MKINSSRLLDLDCFEGKNRVYYNSTQNVCGKDIRKIEKGIETFMSKIAVLVDLHGNMPATEAIEKEQGGIYQRSSDRRIFPVKASVVKYYT